MAQITFESPVLLESVSAYIVNINEILARQ